MPLLSIGNCTNVVSAASGVIDLADDPVGYTGNQKCVWKITTTSLHSVAVMADSLSVRLFGNNE